MRALILLFLACAASAKMVDIGKRSIYTYNVVGRSYAALNSVKDEWAGTIYNATLQYEPSNKGTWGQLSDVTFNEVQGSVWSNWYPTTQDSQPLKLSGQKFGINFENGKISKIQVVEGTPIWEVNFIRSVVNLFQITKASELIPSSLNARQKGQEPYAVFRHQETAVDGRCETLYELTPIPEENQFQVPSEVTVHPKNWIQYVKTTNYSHCERLPLYNVGVPATDGRIGGNRMGEFFSRSNVGKIVKAGLEGPILTSQATSTVIVSPELYNQQKGDVFSQMAMNLTGVKYEYHIDIEIKKMFSKTKWVTYELMNDMSGRPYQEVEASSSSSDSTSSSESLSTEEWQKGRTIHEAPWDPTNFFSPEDAKENIERLLKELSQVDPEPRIPRQELENFMLLTSVLRSLSYNQMKSVTEKYFNARNSGREAMADWMNIRDAVMQAGTGPSFLIVKDLIESKKVIGEEAVRMIAAQATAIRDPHVELIKHFFELVQSKTVEESFPLITATTTAFTTLVRLSIVDHHSARRLYPVRSNGPMALTHIKTVEETYVPYFGQKLKQSVASKKSHLSQLYIHCLGNIAYPTILEVFEPFLEGQQPLSTLQRTLIVISLDKLGALYPRLAMSVFYKMYSNEFEPYQVRVAAIYNLMKTNPPADILQRLATYANVEKSRQVRAALKTAIESAAKLKGEWNIERRRNAQAAVNLLPSDAPGMQYSRQHLVDYVFEELAMAMEHEISYIGSDDDLTPQALFARGAEYYNCILTTGYSFTGMVSSMRDLMDFMSEDSSEESMDMQIRTRLEKLKNMLKSLKMGVKSKNELEGNVQMTFAGVERFFSFNNSTLKLSPETVIQAFLGLLGGVEFNFQSRTIQHETTIAFPTAMAMPFIYNFAQPSVLSVSGSLKADFGLFDQNGQISVTPDMTVSYGSQSQGRMQFVSHTNRSHMAGNERSFRLSTPISGKITVDLNKQSTTVHIDFKGRKEIEVMSFNAQPFTGIGDVQKPQSISLWDKYNPLHVRQGQQIDSTILSKVPGIIVRISGQSEKESAKFFDSVLPSLAFALPMAERTIEPTSVQIMLMPQELESVTFKAFVMDHSIQQTSQQQPFIAEKEYMNSPVATFIGVRASLSLNGPKAEKYDLTIIGNTNAETPQLVVIANSESQYAKLKVVGNFPQTPLYGFRPALRPQRDGVVHISFRHGEILGTYHACSAKIILQRTQERLNHAKTQPQAQQCYSEMQRGNYFHYGCRNATFHAALYDKYDIEVNYQGLSDNIKQKVSQALQVVQNWRMADLSVKTQEVSQEKDQLKATVQYRPDLLKVDVKIDSAIGQYVMSNIPVPREARSIFVVHPTYSMVERVGFGAFRQQWKPTCSIDTTMMSTFDNCTHNFNPAENHWTVMAASDTELLKTEPNNFIVLHRLDAVGHRQISATIGGSKYVHTVEVKPSFSEMKVTLDDEALTLSEGEKKTIIDNGEVILEITNIGLNQIKIASPLIEVVHMATRSVLILKTHRQVIGLCGNNNHEPQDLLTPKGQFLINTDEFLASWTLNAQGSAQKLQKLAEEHGIQRQAPYHSNIISEQDAGRANSQGNPSKRTRYYDASSPESRSLSSEEHAEVSGGLLKRMMVIEKAGQHCFSLQVQSACKAGKKAIASESRNVPFVCVPKNHISSHWKMLVLNGARPDFSDRGKTEYIEVSVPLKCSK